MSDLYTLYNIYYQSGMEVPEELVEAFADIDKALIDPAFDEDSAFN